MACVCMVFSSLKALLFTTIFHLLLIEKTNCSKASFLISNDTFVLDGEALQIISGSIHYFRVPHEYWEDRLLRLKVLGLNTVQVYVPWNQHEPLLGSYVWQGNLDIERFLSLAQKVGVWVNLRPGPYICAEWDAGGMPWWLASSKVAGGRTMKLRSKDPEYMKHVDRWWNTLLPKVAPFMRSRGGPILMVQVENEYGYCGSSKTYLRNLIATAKASLGQDAVIFTTDPPYNVEKGSLPGDEVYTVVDFGPSVDAAAAFAVQKTMNPPGKSPPFCSEFYTGWLVHWGQPMANTSAQQMTDSFTRILEYGNGTGSVNLYMAHGGTNFGFWAGAGLSGTEFQPQITSYDYSAPLSEQGRKGQPGIGGPNKYEMLQEAIAKHTGQKISPWPEPLPTAAYGEIVFNQSLPLLEAVPSLFPGDGIFSEDPVNMEEYDQGHGAILYTTTLAEHQLARGGSLDFGGAVHDYAHVYLGERLIGYLDRSHPKSVQLPRAGNAAAATLKILVHSMGRDSGGCYFDLKGLVNPVSLNGVPLKGWRTFLLPLTDLSPLQMLAATSPLPSRSRRDASGVALPDDAIFLRGTFEIPKTAVRGHTGHFADTFLDLKAWGKGVAFVNGFNLGWYWPSIGPQNNYFVPGTLLKTGSNELILLELEKLPDNKLTVYLAAEPDLWGPLGSRSLDSSLSN